MNSKILKSGHIKLYKRENSKFWQMKIKLPKQRAIRSSSGTKILKEADDYFIKSLKDNNLYDKNAETLTKLFVNNFFWGVFLFCYHGKTV